MAFLYKINKDIAELCPKYKLKLPNLGANSGIRFRLNSSYKYVLFSFKFRSISSDRIWPLNQVTFRSILREDLLNTRILDDNSIHILIKFQSKELRTKDWTTRAKERSLDQNNFGITIHYKRWTKSVLAKSAIDKFQRPEYVIH